MLLKKKDIIEKSYDVIIVGSGLAGMTAANKLAKNGRSVLLLEAHNKLGGFATWCRRQQGDHTFDVSLHGFPVGMIKTCKKYWNREIAAKIHQLPEVRFINPQFEVSTTFTKEDFSKILVEKFGQTTETVESFFDELANMNFYDDDRMTNGELFQKFFPDRSDITRFLLEPIVYANGSNLEDPAISYGIVFSNFMSKGVYIFQGGTDTMINMMKEELLSNDVDIKMHTKIEKIILENGRAIGVEVDGKPVYGNSVLSNANLKTTIDKMVGRENFSPDYMAEADKVRLNTSSCQVYMGIKKGESIPKVGDLVFYSEDKEFSTDLLLSPKVGSQTFSIYYPDTRPHLPDDHYAVVSSSNARWEDWANLNDEEYRNRKKEVINRALECLEKVIPGVREKIDYVDCATPRTVKRYTHHENGASFGTKFEGLPVSQNLHKEIPGLFHAGSVGIIMSGWLGAANYGVIQSHEIDNYIDKLNKDESTNKDNHAN